MKACLVSLAVIFSCIELVHCQSVNCTYTNSTGSYWDLSPLTYNPSDPSPTGYSFSTTTEYTYYVNFCDEVSNSNLDDCNKSVPSGSCQVYNGYYYSAGNFCSAVGSYRTTVINVACDPTVDDFQIVSETSINCIYSLNGISKYGCPITNVDYSCCFYSQNNVTFSSSMCVLKDYGCPNIPGFTEESSIDVSSCDDCSLSPYICCEYSNTQYTTSICSTVDDGCQIISGYTLTNSFAVDSCSDC